MSRVGLVTTFRFVPAVPHEGDQEATSSFERCWSTLESFLLFHLAKGIEHVFLYADANDGSNDAYVDRVAATFNTSQVSVDVRNESQRERQQVRCRLWGELGSFRSTEVPARQSLNAEDALYKAGDMGLDWLLHLDIDELFYTCESSVQPHFDRLNVLGVEQMTYANHEAVPLREDVSDYFREVNTFKLNHLLLPLSHEVAERTRFWRRRTSHGQYMLAYDNGKSAVRVLPDRVVPQSVHRWRTLKPGERGNRSSQASGGDRIDTSCPPVYGQEQGEGGGGRGDGIAAAKTVEGVDNGKCANKQKTRKGRASDGLQAASAPWLSSGSGPDKLVNRVAMADPRELRLDEVLECRDPCVLHYPSCGLSWLRDKYRLLGSFPSSWFDGRLPIAPCFHLDARNAMHQRQGAGAATQGKDGSVGGLPEVDESRVLYFKEVMLCPHEHSEEMQAQLEHGVLCVIGEPASVIEQVLNARGPAGSEVTPATLLHLAAKGARSRDAGPGAVRKQEDTSGAVDAIVAVAEVAECGNLSLPSSVAIALTSTLKGATKEPTLGRSAASVEGVGAPGVDNAWILAACARRFL